MATKDKINKNIEFISFASDVREERVYYCVSCGKKYRVQKGNFITSKSPIFAGNNGYIPMCRKCLVLYYRKMVEFFCGDEIKALDRMCQIFDWYYAEDLAASTSKVGEEGSRVTVYPSKMSLVSNIRGSTYLDTIHDQVTAAIVEEQEAEEELFGEDNNVSRKTLRLFGAGYPAEAYPMLQDNYDTYMAMVASPTNSQKNAAKNAALLQFQIESEIKSGGKNVSTLANSLASILNTNGFNETKMAEGYSNQLDLWIRDIETYCPADYFADKKIYSDQDGFGSYIERFLLRPMRNLLGIGKKEMDSEFNVDREE